MSLNPFFHRVRVLRNCFHRLFEEGKLRHPAGTLAQHVPPLKAGSTCGMRGDSVQTGFSAGSSYFVEFGSEFGVRDPPVVSGSFCCACPLCFQPRSSILDPVRDTVRLTSFATCWKPTSYAATAATMLARCNSVYGAKDCKVYTMLRNSASDLDRTLRNLSGAPGGASFV
jgi:hypothetical protein